MSGAASVSATQHDDSIWSAVAGDPSAVQETLDFSGASLAALEESTGVAARMDEPASAPESDLETDALCASIAPASFGDRVFLFPSETEAWRHAVQMLRRHHGVVGRPKRRRLIVCVGDAEGAEGAPPGLAGDEEIVVLRSDDHGALLTEIDTRTAGILIAPVRTGAGFEVVSGELLVRLREIADEYGLILAFDESFCGLGRSGMLWAHEWTGVTPDLMIAAHGVGEAASLTALVVTQKVTRGALGRPPSVDRAALLAGRALMETLLAPGFLEHVQNRSWRLEDRLTALLYKHRATFAALSGLGLMQGLVCAGAAEPLRARLAERGLLTRPMGPVLGLFPPLTVEESEIDAAVDIIEAICAEEER